MPPLEAWEKVYVDAEAYGEDRHANIPLTCQFCHGGEAVDDFEAAHVGLVADPSATEDNKCALCHREISANAENSLHNTLQGYDTAVYDRSSPNHHATLEEMESYHCDGCHATCGDCHISQPNSVGGGLLDGHDFLETPPMSRTCTGCHGSRVKNEYYGLNEGLPGDVHLRQARLACTDCHSGDEMHGMTNEPVTHRYDGVAEPRCETCHEDDLGENSTVLQHQLHGTDLLSCQSCHSVAYTNCVNCHVDRSEEDVPFFTVEEHFTGFFLGRNTLQSEERPWAYVPVRHVPVDPESFSAYGEDLLNNFLNRPTWSYATPHSIQRNTPQTETCITCHDNDQFFLTPDKVEEFELGGANLDVVVENAPPFPGNLPEKMEAALAAIEQAEQMKAEQGAAVEEAVEEAEPALAEENAGDPEAAPADAPDGGTGSFWSNSDTEASDAESQDGASSFWSD